MKPLMISFLFFCIPALIYGQHLLHGKVTDDKGRPIAGANVYLKGSFDGASTATDGSFGFDTTLEGNHELVVSMMGFAPYGKWVAVSSVKGMDIVLKKDVSVLEGVTLTAGSFTAGDNSKASVLKPLDIVTTAGAAGDFVAALQTLPGTSTVNEDGSCSFGEVAPTRPRSSLMGSVFSSL